MKEIWWFTGCSFTFGLVTESIVIIVFCFNDASYQSLENKISAGTHWRHHFLPHQNQDHLYQLICPEYIGFETPIAWHVLAHNTRTNGLHLLWTGKTNKIYKMYALTIFHDECKNNGVFWLNNQQRQHLHLLFLCPVSRWNPDTT